MHSETIRRAVLSPGANYPAVSPPEGLPAPPHQPVPPRTLCSLGALCVSRSLSTLNFRLSTAFFSHSCASLEKSPLCFHILTKPFSRSPFILTFLQNPRGCPPCARKRDHSNFGNSKPTIRLQVVPIANSKSHIRSAPGRSQQAVPPSRSSPHNAPELTANRAGRMVVPSLHRNHGCGLYLQPAANKRRESVVRTMSGGSTCAERY